MAFKLKMPAAKPKGLQAAMATAKPAPKGRVVLKGNGLTESKIVKAFDIPIDRLVGHLENPNEQDEKTFDQIVQRIKEDGFDEPILVVPELKNGSTTSNFLIVSGHHRVKAAKLAGMKFIPAVIREGWNEDRVLMELVGRNELRGQLNGPKFTEIWEKLKKRGWDAELLKRQMGLTNKKKFDALFKQVAAALPAKQKKALEEAKENVNSVEDLTSVLNQIFKDHGSEVDHSFMVFTFGGKRHHYIQVSAGMNKMLDTLKARCEKDGVQAGALFHELLSNNPTIVDNAMKKLKANVAS